jgi:hypothetical protein
VRGIIGYIAFFTCGLVAAGAYFYQLHPEHSIDTDLPRMRKQVDEAVDRGRKLRDAWETSSSEPAEKPKESAVQK